MQKKIKKLRIKMFFSRIFLLTILVVSLFLSGLIIGGSIYRSNIREIVLSVQKSFSYLYLTQVFLIITLNYLGLSFFPNWIKELGDDIKRGEEGRIFRQSILKLF